MPDRGVAAVPAGASIRSRTAPAAIPSAPAVPGTVAAVTPPAPRVPRGTIAATATLTASAQGVAPPAAVTALPGEDPARGCEGKQYRQNCYSFKGHGFPFY